MAVDTNDVQARRLAERLAAAILAEPDEANTLPAQTPFRVRAGCHAVSDFRLASIDSSELMLRATAALQQARTDLPDAWLQEYR